jgi:hypothetical protein
MLPEGSHWLAPVPDDDTPRFEPHDNHRLHPLLRGAGWGESPCTNAACPEYDDKHDEAMEEAYFRPGAVETHDPHSVRLNGFEKNIDPGTVLRYLNHPEQRSERLPKVFTYRGDKHVLDGHHRLLADQAAGRPLTFEHVDLDREA